MKPENLKPSMKVASIDEVPLPAVLTAKADGEFTTIFYSMDRGSFSINLWGRIRQEANSLALREVTESLRRNGVGEATILAELYAVKDGTPQRLDRFLAHKEAPDLHLGIFDIVTIDGRSVNEDYEWKIGELEKWFSVYRYARVLPNTKVFNREKAREFYRSCLELGYEGVVARTNTDTYKIKPIRDLDAVIIGINKKPLLKEGKVTSLKLAIVREDGSLIDVTDVASGIDLKLRRELYRLIDLKVQEDSKTIYIKPLIVAKIVYQETYEADRPLLKWDGSKYSSVGSTRFLSLRSPRLVDFRKDKKPTPEDIGVNQL